MTKFRETTSYSGGLARPIRRLRPFRLDGATNSKEEIARHNQEILKIEDAEISRVLAERLELLFAHYEIQDTNNYMALTLALAIDHVPGFSVEWQSQSSNTEIMVRLSLSNGLAAIVNGEATRLQGFLMMWRGRSVINGSRRIGTPSCGLLDMTPFGNRPTLGSRLRVG